MTQQNKNICVVQTVFLFCYVWKERFRLIW